MREKIAIKTDLDLIKESVRRSGLADGRNVEWGKGCRWAGRDLAVGKPSPMNEKMMVVALFHDEHTIRVYEVQRVDQAGADLIAPRRVSLSKNTQGGTETFVLEDMTLDRMADVLADELSMLEGAISSGERERNAVLDYGRALPPEYPMKEFLADLEAEEHLEADEDTEEEEEGPNGAGDAGNAGKEARVT